MKEKKAQADTAKEMNVLYAKAFSRPFTHNDGRKKYTMDREQGNQSMAGNSVTRVERQPSVNLPSKDATGHAECHNVVTDGINRSSPRC